MINAGKSSKVSSWLCKGFSTLVNASSLVLYWIKEQTSNIFKYISRCTLCSISIRSLSVQKIDGKLVYIVRKLWIPSQVRVGQRYFRFGLVSTPLVEAIKWLDSATLRYRLKTWDETYFCTRYPRAFVIQKFKRILSISVILSLKDKVDKKIIFFPPHEIRRILRLCMKYI